MPTENVLSYAPLETTPALQPPADRFSQEWLSRAQPESFLVAGNPKAETTAALSPNPIAETAPAALRPDPKVEAAPASVSPAAVPLPKPVPKRTAALPRPVQLEPVPVASPGARARAPVVGDLAALIAAKAEQHGVPLALANAVVRVESNFQPGLTGRGGTLGLMQIKHSTARGMGFAGSARDLLDPSVNLEWGMRYLAGARKLANNDLCNTVLKYQGGHRASHMTGAASKYCGKVRSLLARVGDRYVAQMQGGR